MSTPLSEKAICGCPKKDLTYKTCDRFETTAQAKGRCVTCGHSKPCHDAKCIGRIL